MSGDGGGRFVQDKAYPVVLGESFKDKGILEQQQQRHDFVHLKCACWVCVCVGVWGVECVRVLDCLNALCAVLCCFVYFARFHDWCIVHALL